MCRSIKKYLEKECAHLGKKSCGMMNVFDIGHRKVCIEDAIIDHYKSTLLEMDT